MTGAETGQHVRQRRHIVTSSQQREREQVPLETKVVDEARRLQGSCRRLCVRLRAVDVAASRYTSATRRRHNDKGNREQKARHARVPEHDLEAVAAQSA
jgi:hypothetical protein